MARKVFQNGYPLPASDLNTYLMDQSVQTFADATARTAALATPSEGMMSYLNDTNTVYTYDGAAWNAQIDAANYGTLLPNGAAGRNKVINGGFDIWQRGTSYSLVPGAFGYFSADRWRHYNGATGSTCTLSKQTFTPGTAPAAGYEAEAYHRIAVSGWTSGNIEVETRIEDVRTFAGQTVTLSFWAKASTATTLTGIIRQNFGSGGSGSVDNGTTAFSVTTSWARYSVTVALASISGKTIGSGSFLNPFFYFGANSSVDIWGVQLEAGSVATPFSRAGGTLQGELAACQRYYYRQGGLNTYQTFGIGAADQTTTAQMIVTPPVTMRTAPTSVDFSTLAVTLGATTAAVSNLVLSTNNEGNGTIYVYATSTGLTQYRPYLLCANASTNAYVGFSAEL